MMFFHPQVEKGIRQVKVGGFSTAAASGWHGRSAVPRFNPAALLLGDRSVLSTVAM